MLHRTSERQIIIRQAHTVPAGEEQPSAAIFTHGMTRIDMIRQPERYRFAPWSFDIFSPRDENIVHWL